MLRVTALFAILATPLAAQEDKEKHCQITSEIVSAGVAERVGGADEETAIGAVEEALPDEQAKYRPAVAPIVKWIYELEVEVLDKDVAASYVKACLEQ